MTSIFATIIVISTYRPVSSHHPTSTHSPSLPYDPYNSCKTSPSCSTFLIFPLRQSQMTPIAAALSLFFLLAIVASSPDPVPHKGVCIPKSCGDVTNITYPFWVSGQPDYCGFPDFELRCEEDDTLSLQTAGVTYQVRNIFYDNQSILVAPDLADVGSSDADCLTYHNLTFTTTPFNVSSANKVLLLIYNCTKPPPPLDYYAISCGGFERYSLLYDNYSFLEHLSLPAPCEVAVLPVLGLPGATPMNYFTLINEVLGNMGLLGIYNNICRK